MPRKGSAPEAIKKLSAARELVLKAEDLIQSVTAQELVDAGYCPTTLAATHEVYRVFAHATALRIIRELLHMDYLS